jgi:hypothetical protein
MEDALASIEQDLRSIWLAKLLVLDQKLGDQPMKTRILDLEFRKPVVVACRELSMMMRRRRPIVEARSRAFSSVSSACVGLIHT